MTDWPDLWPDSTYGTATAPISAMEVGAFSSFQPSDRSLIANECNSANPYG
jgi:hypothetical protein